MIINNRLKGLVELDELMRKAGRSAQQTGSFDDQARHAAHRIRSGESAHEVMRPHVDAYVNAQREINNAYRRQVATAHRGHSPEMVAAIRASDAAQHNLHQMAGAIGRHAGEFLTRDHSDRASGLPPGHPAGAEDHLHNVARLHGAHGTSTGGAYTVGGHAFRARFHTPEAASNFHNVAKRVFPHHRPVLETPNIVKLDSSVPGPT